MLSTSCVPVTVVDVWNRAMGKTDSIPVLMEEISNKQDNYLYLIVD